MNFAHRHPTKDQHQLPGKMKLGRARRAFAIHRPFDRFHDPCHSERRRGIWPRTSGMARSQPHRDARCCVSTDARRDNDQLAAFTLIELLVVIAVIALLMAILLPTLQRVRRQVKAIICRSNLRQWGTMFYAYTEDNDRRFFESLTLGGYPDWCRPMEYYRHHNEKLLFCPMATKHKPRANMSPEWGGGKDSAWDLSDADPHYVAGSYAFNHWTTSLPKPLQDSPRPRRWQTCLDRRAHSVPVLLDGIYGAGMPENQDQPPDPEDAHPPKADKGGTCMMGHFCVNRHDSYENALCLDWSVRKVGLKELWTLKWHREYNTSGKWTKAGGVQPEDWPAWMRRFKDY